MGFSFVLPILVTLVGAYFLIKLRFFFILHPARTAKRLFGALGDRGARRSLSLALAGTLGVGNIFGVAMGIIIGGEGVILWLIISSLFSSVIKYAEALTVKDSGVPSGGMAAVIERVFPLFKLGAARLYSVLCLFLALVMGAAIQTGSVSSAAENIMGLSPVAAAAVFSVFVLAVILGGARKIVDATEKIIPLTTLIYIIVAILAISVNFQSLFDAISRIINSAFSLASVAGGAFSSVFSLAMTEGYARGILSNEAGAGTSAMAHAKSEREPSEAGLFGICEVFFDTPLLCTLTGLVIVTAPLPSASYSSPMALVTDAFSASLGAPASVAVFLCVLLFAYSTVICWYYYGSECLLCLFGHKLTYLYTPTFVGFIFVGALVDSFFITAVCDVILLLMTVLTLTALLLSSHRIVSISEMGGIIKTKNKRKSD